MPRRAKCRGHRGRTHSDPLPFPAGPERLHPRPETPELLQRPARRRDELRRLRRAAHLPALPEDGGRAIAPLIVDDLEAALAQFRPIAEDLEGESTAGAGLY